MKIEPFIDKIFIQPTGQCNLNCSYCYIPKRNIKRQIEYSTVQKIVDFITHLKLTKRLDVIWHSGEPLMLDIKQFHSFLRLFQFLNVRHRIQTNGTLLNNDWCDLIEEFNIGVTISIDGNEKHNIKRVNWNNKQTHEKALEKIALLKERNIKFNAICTIHEKNISEPNEVFDFIKKINPAKVGFSIVEKENYNIIGNTISKEQTNHFWTTLFNRWKKDNNLQIREFDLMFSNMMNSKNFELDTKYLDLNITFGYNGDVVILSPEFLDSDSDRQFIIGNVNTFTQKELMKAISNSSYLHDFALGIKKCYSNCSYFDFCEGGNASNKYYENGLVSSTTTNHCYQSRILLVDSILKNL